MSRASLIALGLAAFVGAIALSYFGQRVLAVILIPICAGLIAKGALKGIVK